MIFTSLGLLVVAAGFLIAGITKSSVALLTLSLVITLAAGAMLIMVSAASKRLAGEGGGLAGPAPAMAGTVPAGAAMPTGPVMMYVPMQAAPMQTAPMQTATMDPTIDGNGHGNGATPPVVGYDSMTAVQITRLIGSGALTDEQLASLRDYERANAARKTVLDPLDSQLGS